MKKQFVLDTSVLIHDPSAIYNFDEHDVFLSYVTILEIDGLRKVPNGRGQAAREFVRQLDSLSQKSPTLVNVTLGENKGNLSVSMLGIPENLDIASEIPKAFRDDVIIQCAKKLQEDHENVILVSKDVGQRIKAAINGIPAQDYLNTKIKNWDQHYTGLHSDILVLPPLKNGDPYKDIIPAPDYLYQNEFCHVQFENYGNVAPILCRKKGDKLILVPDFKTGVQGVYPIDEYQRMALDVLLDPEVLIVAISGLAGSGKTLCSMAAAIEAYEHGKIETIMYVKPIIPVGGRDLGYLPGDKEEKLMNWAKPLYDNLKVIEMAKGKKYGGDMFNDPMLNIELEAYTYMRGRTFHSSWVILDECLTGDNVVWLSNGKALPIKDIKNDDIAISLDIQNNIVNNNKIYNKFNKKSKLIVNIKTSRGIINCTPEHPLYVYENGKNFTIKLAKDITRRDLLPFINKLPHIENNNLSIEESSLLALILADGTIEKTLYNIKIDMSKDQDWLLQLCSNIFPKVFTKFNLNCKNIRNNMICKISGKKEILEWVMKHSLTYGKKANMITVPEMIWDSPVESVKRFISIFFDCEGDININNINKKNIVISLSTTSKIFAHQMQALLAKFDIMSSVFQYKDHKENHNIIYRVCIVNYFAKKFFEDIGFTMERKQNNYTFIKDNVYDMPYKYPCAAYLDAKKCFPNKNKWQTDIYSVNDFNKEIKISKLNNKDLCITKNTYDKIKELMLSKGIDMNDYPTCCKILDIEYESLEKSIDVYDFSVDNDHTFIVDGIISSNCQNSNPLEARTALSRMGEKSKCVILADLTQIDNPYTDAESCGFSVAVETLKDHPIFAAVPLVRSKRSEISKLIAERMNPKN